jgi:peptide deformylase
MRAEIRRPEHVRVKWTDLDGERCEGEFDGLLARIIQHEYDHLDGILFFERMQPTDRLRVRDELKAFEEQFVPR